MGFIGQTWTLTKKNLLISWNRHWFSTFIRAFLAPIIFMFFISYAKNFFVPPSDFGIGAAQPLRSFPEALALSAGGRNTLPFVTNGLGSEVQTVISSLSTTVRNAGLTPLTLANDIDLLTTCRSSIRGTSSCFAAVTFHSSPSQGGLWNYTLHADGSFGERIYVNSDTNDAQIYALPLQHAIDSTIAEQTGVSLPVPNQYPFTTQTAEQRARLITRLYMGALIKILAVAYFVGIVGICYQLTGQMAEERELGMSQLIEAMMPNKRRWEPQAIRLISNHLAFDIIYLPGWIIMAAIVAGLNYPSSSVGAPIGFFILAGLALASWSIAFASLFRKAQLSGITVTIVSIVLAIIVQVQTPQSTGAVVILALLFPPMNYTLFIIYLAHWQQVNLPTDLSLACPTASWRVPGYAFFIFAVLQILIYPVVGAILERTLYGTASRARTMNLDEADTDETVRITGLCKYYEPSWFSRTIPRLFGKKRLPETVRAVNNLDMTIRRGELSVLLGANGSGKSTTMDMLAGLQAPSHGTIQIDGTGGLGLCPQKNVIWDELTCEEHVRIFNALKADRKDSKQVIRDLLTSCDLDHKIQARSKTLSGGQKRKLQLAMMLTGGSSLCLLDEVSSGLDPLSRRKIWDILLAERGRRSMLFTTHFLDEADLLSDRITVLSKGHLKASGSAVALKHEHGGGYRVKLYNENKFEEPKDWADIRKSTHADHVVYHLADSAAAAAFVTQLEGLGVEDYRVMGLSVEDVFLKLATEIQPETQSSDEEPLTMDMLQSGEKGLQLAPGRKISVAAQTWVLFRKRITILRYNYLPYVAAVLIPVIAAGLVTLFVQNFQQIGCNPTDGVSTPLLQDLATLGYSYNLRIPVGPPSAVPSNAFNTIDPALGRALRSVTSLQALEAYVAANYSRVNPGGFFIDQNAAPTFAWRGNYEMTYAVLTMNLMDNAILRNIPIYTTYQSFALPFAPSAGDSLQFILYFGLAFTAATG